MMDHPATRAISVTGSSATDGLALLRIRTADSSTLPMRAAPVVASA
jgi:hypothetical protein